MLLRLLGLCALDAFQKKLLRKVLRAVVVLLPLVVPELCLHGHVKDELQNEHQHEKRQRRALALERPRALHGEIVLWVQHERLAEIPLLQDDQNVVEDERRSVRKVYVLGQRRAKQPHACPHGAGQKEQETAQDDIGDLRFDRPFAVDLDRGEHEHEDAERGEDAEHKRKPAGDRRADPLAEDVARDACPGQIWLEIAGFHVVGKRGRVGDRGKDWNGEQDDVAAQSIQQQLAVIAVHHHCVLHAEHGQRVRKRADQQAQNHAAVRDQIRPSE